jgi:hypothetical protein
VRNCIKIGNQSHIKLYCFDTRVSKLFLFEYIAIKQVVLSLGYLISAKIGKKLYLKEIW